MNLYSIKCSKFAKNKNIKIKREIVETFIFILVVLIVILKILKLLIKKR